MRSMIVSLTACALLCTAVYAADSSSSAPVADDAKPDGTVTLSGGSVAAGIGYTWGHGELKYQDASHSFAIKGFRSSMSVRRATPPRETSIT
jgi:hypothetical protein